MLRITFILLFVISNLIAIGQSEPELRPFMDYTKCYTGFRNERGVQVWEPEFDWVQKLRTYSQKYDQYSFWMVKHKSDLVGLLDNEGRIVVPFIYDLIIPSPGDRFKVKKGDSWGLIDENGKILFDTRYESIDVVESGFIVCKNGKCGFLDSAYNEILEMRYDAIMKVTIRHGYEDVSEYSSKVFLIKDSSHYGVFHVDHGLIIEPKYSFIEPQWIDRNCDGLVGAYLVYKDDVNAYGVCNQYGKSVIPLQKNRIEVFSLQTGSCGVPSKTYAVMQRENRSSAFLINTGKESLTYDRLIAFQGRFIYYSGKEWGILDTNLNEMYRSSKHLPSFSKYDNPKPTEWGHTFTSSFEHFQHSGTLNWNDDLIFTCKVKNPKAEEHDREYQVGLLNYKTEKSIPTKYDYILIREWNGKKVYWAFINKANQGSNDYRCKWSHFDVYDESMKKLTSNDIECLIDGLREYSEIPKIDRLTIFEDKQGKFGAFSMEGKLVVPNKFTFYKRFSTEQNLYIFGSEEEKGLYDGSGKQVIPEEYTGFSTFQDGILALNDELTTIYSKDFNQIAKEVKSIWGGVNLNRNGLSLNSNDADSNIYSFCFNQNDTLYVYEKDRVFKGDSTRFDFNQEYLFLFKKFSIDKSGKIFQGNKNLPERRIEIKKDVPVNPFPGTIPVASEKRQTPFFYWRSVNTGAKPAQMVWHLYDSLNNQKVIDLDFEFPFAANNPYTRIFKANGKFGIISKEYHILVQPEYDYIYSLGGSFALFKDALWQIYHPELGFSPEHFTAICTFSYKKGRIVFSGNKAGVIDSKLQMVIPLKDTGELISSVDLLKFLEFEGLNISNETYAYEGWIYNAQPAELYKQINNRHILKMALLRSTKNEFLDYRIPPFGSNYLYANKLPEIEFHFNERKTMKRIQPNIYSKYFYSETIFTKEKSLGSVYFDNEWAGAHMTTTNYKIIDNKLKPVSFNEIFKTDSKSVEILDGLLKKELNRLQLQGLVCSNIEETILEMKRNFYLDRYGVSFPIYTSLITLSYSKLELIMIEYWKF